MALTARYSKSDIFERDIFKFSLVGQNAQHYVAFFFVINANNSLHVPSLTRWN